MTRKNTVPAAEIRNAIGTQIKDLNLPEHVVIAAIIRNDEIVVPRGITSFEAGDEVLLFVNGMGGTPLVELYIVYRKAYEIATKAGLKVVRNLVGPYITSLEMAGCSITMLKMDQDLLSLWDAPVKTPGMRWGV
jgi:dihydroxyacetone kinase